MSGSRRASQATISQLQSTLLTSVLRQQPLPGGDAPVRFPDLAWIIDPPTLLVAAENIAGELKLAETGKATTIMPEAEIRNLAAREGDHAYVYFQPASEQDNQITLVIEVRLAPSEPDIKPLGLGGIRARFARTPSGTWEVAEPPAVFGV